jgi:hypothetical protein
MQNKVAMNDTLTLLSTRSALSVTIAPGSDSALSFPVITPDAGLGAGALPGCSRSLLTIVIMLSAKPSYQNLDNGSHDNT